MKKRLAISILGVVVLSVSAVSAATTSCSTVAACVMGINTSSGYGVEGTSKTNDGLVGITTQPSTSASNGRSGIAGYDNSTNKGTYNSGVYGVSTYGTGVNGKGGLYGLTGTASSKIGAGVAGFSNAGAAIAGSSTSGPGVQGFSRSYYGGTFNSTFSRSLDLDPYGEGPFTTVENQLGALVLYGRVPSNEGGPNDLLFSVVGCFAVHNAPNNTCEPSYQLYADGSTMSGASYVRTKRSTGADVASYGARMPIPTIEDLGKGELQNGTAYIPLESTFASTIDSAAGYMVFLTPEGDSRGLYTTRFSPKGFVVRENDGGRSTLIFDYRIVAHPMDTRLARFPATSAIAK